LHPASAFLAESAAGGDAMDALRMRSTTSCIATGALAGRDGSTLPADADAVQADAGQVDGFSLHLGVDAKAHECDRLERACRDSARLAIAERRPSISPQGWVRDELKIPWREPLPISWTRLRA